MFDSLDEVDWKNLKTSSGNAGHIPKALFKLVSDQVEIQKRGYWKLENYIVLQGDLYESAYYTIPFLIEILNSNSINSKKLVYNLLYEIANGYSVDNTTISIQDKQLPLSEACPPRSLKSLANSGDFRAGMNEPKELTG